MTQTFALGTIVATPACLQVLERGETSPAALLARHAAGDWGCVSNEDAQLNNRAVAEGERIAIAMWFTLSKAHRESVEQE